MNDKDPMTGSAEEQAEYKRQIMDMIQQDIEERKQQRIAEFQATREAPAVIQGAVGTQGSITQALNG